MDKEDSMKKRFTDEQIIRILREAESRDEPVKDLCKRHNISEQTFYRWRNKFGGMDVADARRLKELESENDRLKRLIAEQMLVIDGLKEFSRKNEHPNGPARSAGSPDSAGALATQGMSPPGTEPPSGDLYAQATGEGSELGREADGGRARGAALRLSPDVGLAGVERIARAANVASPSAQHSAPTSSSTSLWRRHTPARRHTAQFG
ncbi:transposase [Burkholderia contaminans]|nr:transposase [Burkholderia contaminans]